MSVYVITEVSKGVGLELVKQISKDPKDLVIGLLNDKPTTQMKVAQDYDRGNVHILYGNLTSHASLERAAVDTAEIVGERGIDYLVANGAFPSHFDTFIPLGGLDDKFEELEATSLKLFQTNVIGNIHLFNLFLPLVMKGRVKKVIALSSGHADLDFINYLEVETCALYAASMAALNVIVAKFNAQYKKDGVLFLSISPGVIEVGHLANLTPDQIQHMLGIIRELPIHAPDLKSLTTVDEAVPNIRSNWEKASIDGGYGGAFISHLWNKHQV